MIVHLADLSRRPILETSTATTVGEVVHAIVDPASSSIVGFQLEGAPGDASVLPWSAIKAIGPDALTIEASSDLRRADGRAEERAIGESLDPIGARVLDSCGVERGSVTELAFDGDTGHVETVVTTEGDLPGDGILGIGRYALIVDGDRL
jgi:sporulation protein YlmC with PRC-barrel domain